MDINSVSSVIQKAFNLDDSRAVQARAVPIKQKDRKDGDGESDAITASAADEIVGELRGGKEIAVA